MSLHARCFDLHGIQFPNSCMFVLRILMCLCSDDELIFGIMSLNDIVYRVDLNKSEN